MKKVVLLALVCFALILSSQSTFAQESVKNRVGFLLAAASGDIDEIGIGGIGEFKVAEKISISPQLIFYFPENDVNVFEVNANVNYYFYNKDIFEFYGLAGLNLTRWSYDYEYFDGQNFRKRTNSDSELGLNIGGGINFEIGKSFVPFSELRLTIGELDQFVISGGLKFNLGK